MLLRSGASLSEASSLFEEDGMDTALRQTSTGGSAFRLRRARRFSAAAEKTGVFRNTPLSVFSTADLSGRLDEALDRLATTMTAKARYTTVCAAPYIPGRFDADDVRRAGGARFAVLPMFERVYDNLTGSLLSSSYAYVLAATLIGRISLVLRGFLGIVLLALAFGMRSDKGREKLRNTMETSRFTRRAAWLFGGIRGDGHALALFASGTDEDSALALCIEQTRHKKLHEALENAVKKQMGVGIATAFAHQKILARHVRQMLLGGAQSGELVQVTENLARRTAQEAENGLCSVIDRTEPIFDPDFSPRLSV